MKNTSTPSDNIPSCNGGCKSGAPCKRPLSQQCARCRANTLARNPGLNNAASVVAAPAVVDHRRNIVAIH